MSTLFPLDFLDRMVQAVEKVRERQTRATTALKRADVWYALAGGNAAAAWVDTVDRSAVRNTPDVVMLVRRDDALAADVALRAVGFDHIQADRPDLYFDAPVPPGQSFSRLARKSVRLVFAEVGDPIATESVLLAGVNVLPLEALVCMELGAGRTLNKLFVCDLIDVGLVDATWCDRLPPLLADRLRELLA